MDEARQDFAGTMEHLRCDPVLRWVKAGHSDSVSPRTCMYLSEENTCQERDRMRSSLEPKSTMSTKILEFTTLWIDFHAVNYTISSIRYETPLSYQNLWMALYQLQSAIIKSVTVLFWAELYFLLQLPPLSPHPANPCIDLQLRLYLETGSLKSN